MSHDPIFHAFLERQFDEGLALARTSDVVTISPWGPQHYVLRFRCRGLVTEDGMPRVHDEFRVGIFFPPDHVRVAQPASRVVQWLSPATVFHPNISPPLVCLGAIAPGEGLVDLAFRLYELITFHRASPHDALNVAAAQWARRHRAALPLDRRPLRRPIDRPHAEVRR
jgi:hypothetical protein